MPDFNFLPDFFNYHHSILQGNVRFMDWLSDN